MKIQRVLRLFLLIVALACTHSAMAAFRNIVVSDVTTLLTEEERSSQSSVTFGVAVADDGSVSRVVADDAASCMTVSGSYHSNHGMNKANITVAVEGPVKIGVGNCTYGAATVVKDANGNEVANITRNDGCYDQDATKVSYAYYSGEATTLSYQVQYCTYLSVEAVDDVPVEPEKVTVSYGKGLYFGAQGNVPASEEIEKGATYTLPRNYTLYNEGFTLTGWNVDGTTCAPGSEVVVENDVTISPVFTANEVALSDRTEEVTIDFVLTLAKGAPSYKYEAGSGIVVTQATVNGKTIDVKMDVDATNGKFNNSNGSWVQINPGTKLVVPACMGAMIAFETYSEVTTTTVNGEVPTCVSLGGAYNSTYTCTDEVQSVEVISNESGQYIRSMQVVLPKEEAPAPAFKDIVIANVCDLLTEEERSSQSSVTFGVAVADDGSVSRVAADDAAVCMTVSGSYHSNHGMNKANITVAVEGPVKIGVGNCTYGAATVVKDANGNEVANITRNDGCYDQDATKVSYAYYSGEATTLSYQVQYCTYLSVEAVDDVPVEPEMVTVTFAQGEALGVAPNAIEVEVGEKFEIPANRTLYVEGKTLTGWSDGTNTYAVGSELTVGAEDLNLTPVFVGNEVSLADRTEAITLNYVFGESNGAPSFAWEGSKGVGLLVVQATIGNAVIDVKMDVDASNGKFNNKGRGDKWAQINNGTIFTIPSCQGATVSLEAYAAINETTIDGVKWESGSNTPSFTCAGDAETIQIVMGENTYVSSLTIVLPVVESDVIVEERAIIIGDFANWPAVALTGGVRSFDIETNFSKETITYTFSEKVGLFNGVVDQAESKFPDQPVGYIKSEKSETEIVTSTFKNITRVRYLHGATGSSRGFKLEKKSATDADWVLLSDAAADPSKGAWVECNVNEENVQLRWSNLAPKQYAYMFEMEIYANVEITAEQVTLEAVASPVEGGSVSIYPASGQYDINSVVKLTAIENFGYDFVNWTDHNGNVLSTEPEVDYTIAENSVVTANFEAVDTYALVVNVEGGANEYMVVVAPDPVEVDGQMMFEEGTEVTLSATNNPILTFSNWASGETSSNLVVTIDADKDITAIYSAVDYLVGWDFIKAGKNSRAADFVSSSDNESTTLVLRNAEGAVAAWLDKSQEAAGGYEGKPGAVNWQMLADKYYFQTKVNALNFTNIKVQAEMLYNFIAYEVQVLEYSLDGETWKEATRLTLPAAKAWTPIVATLPAECNNAEELYLRWIPDYTSTIVGSEGKGNDGTSITNIYITGTTAVYDDGKAPVVVSTIPNNDAQNVSATGRIVVNFDENVVVAENAVATLGDKTIAPVVSGKTLTFNYMGLSYNTHYTFTLPANSVSDRSGNVLAEAITLSFTTITPPVVAEGVYDAEVSDATELLAALETANAQASSGKRYRIFLHEGVYDLGEKCLTEVKSNISLIGESMENTVIVNKAPAEGIGVSATLLLTGSDIYMQDLTIKNTYDYDGSTGRAVCVQDKGNKNIFKHVRMLSYQDTYYTNNNQMRAYHENSEIHGTVDFICGGGDVFFNQSTLYLEERSSANCITAPNGDTDWGYVFSNCLIDGHAVNNGQYNLGRPWNGTPRCVWLNTTMKVLPSAAGWTSMQVLPELFAEYNSVTESGNLVDLSGRTTTFEVNGEMVTATYNPVLTATEAAEYTIENVLAGDDQWQPNLLTEQVAAPVLSISEGVMTWDDTDYEFCYAICCNGKVVAFTNECRYEMPAEATEADYYSVRAANEMGGLGLPSEEYNIMTNVVAQVANAEVVNTMIFTIDGMIVPTLQDGINIVRKTYSNGDVTVEKVLYRKH